MNIRRCHRIALRIDALLRPELGHGIDTKRLLTEALYARDVLLVCDAHQGSDLAALAQHFRAAVAAVDDNADAAGQPSTQSGLSSSFSSESDASRPATLPGALSSTLPGALPGAPRARLAQKASSANWFSPSRWLSK